MYCWSYLSVFRFFQIGGKDNLYIQNSFYLLLQLYTDHVLFALMLNQVHHIGLTILVEFFHLVLTLEKCLANHDGYLFPKLLLISQSFLKGYQNS